MSKTNEFIAFVFDDKSEGITYYTHRTDDEKVAMQILKEGFHFSESFQKTTDLLLNDTVHIRYWQNLRKEYGSYTVVIGISTTLLQIYQSLLNTSSKKNIEVQQILTEKDPFALEEADEVYTVPIQFIKGFWKGKEGIAHVNDQFDPYFDSPIFKRNIDNVLSTT